MLVGLVYRFRVTGIPKHEGEELYPTVEIINRLYPPVGEELKFPVPIELTQEDLDSALEGRFITRIVYVENPRQAYPRAEDPNVQECFEVNAKTDPLAAADRLGRPIAIVRIGGRTPEDTANPGGKFMYNSPALLLPLAVDAGNRSKKRNAKPIAKRTLPRDPFTGCSDERRRARHNLDCSSQRRNACVVLLPRDATGFECADRANRQSRRAGISVFRVAAGSVHRSSRRWLHRAGHRAAVHARTARRSAAARRDGRSNADADEQSRPVEAAGNFLPLAG